MKVTDLHKYGSHAEMKRILTQPHHRSPGFKIAFETWADWNPVSDCIHVVYHDTEIATLYPDGSVKVNSGGWRTKTTKYRLNAYIPQQFTLYADKGVWYVMSGRNYHNVETGVTGREFVSLPYKDGMTFFQDGTVAHNETGRFDPFMYKGSTLWGFPVK